MNTLYSVEHRDEQAFLNVWYDGGDVLDDSERNFEISDGPWQWFNLAAAVAPSANTTWLKYI